MMTKQWIPFLVLAAAVAAPAHAAGKVAASKHAAKSVRAPSKPTEPVATAVPAVELLPLSAEQLAIAEKVHLGHIPCELSAHVTLTPHPHAAGRFLLEIGHQRYAMEPVITSTGAVRLEDVSAGAVWLQLANKSMLMNQKLGKRIADECMSPDQQVIAQAMARSPAPGLLDAPKPAPVPVVLAQPAPGPVPTATE